MKKYTILSSDTEDEKSVKHSVEQNKPLVDRNCIKGSNITPERAVQQTEEEKNMNISKVKSRMTQKQISNNTELLTWDIVRTPSIKSDEEISYWITTAKAPCLYYFDNDIHRTFIPSDLSYDHKMKDYQYIKDKGSSNLKSNYIVNGKTYELPKYIPSNNLSCNQISANVESKSHNFKKLNKDETSDVKRNGLNNNGGNFKCKDTLAAHTQPLDDYDSDSSVLTINYIKYVNNKQANNIKQLKRKRTWEQSGGDINSSIDSLNLIKNCKSISKDSGCASQDKDCNTLDSIHHSHIRSSCERSNIKHKSIHNIDNILKPSFEATKLVNSAIFDNSKMSSSSIENRNSNIDPNFFKYSSKADKSLTYFNAPSRPGNNYIASTDTNVSQVIYTKVETLEYIAHSFPSTMHSNVVVQSISSNNFSTCDNEGSYRIS